MIPQGKRTVRSRGAFWLRLAELAVRLAAVGLGVWIVLRTPMPVLDDWLPVKNVAAVAVGLVLAGKALYDTLFYDRFSP